jgi:hypothetical protein
MTIAVTGLMLPLELYAASSPYHPVLSRVLPTSECFRPGTQAEEFPSEASQIRPAALRKPDFYQSAELDGDMASTLGKCPPLVSRGSSFMQ